jgi:hypothetical protein
MKAWVLTAAAGLGMPAAGGTGSYLAVSLTFDRTSIGIGETAVATMTASWDGLPGSCLASVNVDLIASGPSVFVSDVAPVAWNNPALGFDGQGIPSGPDVLGLNAAQFSLIPPHTTDNPVLITTFTVTGTAAGMLSYRSETAAGAPYPYSVDPLFGPIPDPPGNEVFVSETLVVTPGPGVGGVLVVACGMVAGRRRR